MLDAEIASTDLNSPTVLIILLVLQTLALQQCTGYKPSELKDCVLVIHELQSSLMEATGRALREKYMNHKVLSFYLYMKLLYFIVLVEFFLNLNISRWGFPPK